MEETVSLWIPIGKGTAAMGVMVVMALPILIILEEMAAMGVREELAVMQVQEQPEETEVQELQTELEEMEVQEEMVDLEEEDLVMQELEQQEETVGMAAIVKILQEKEEMEGTEVIQLVKVIQVMQGQEGMVVWGEKALFQGVLAGTEATVEVGSVICIVLGAVVAVEMEEGVETVMFLAEMAVMVEAGALMQEVVLEVMAEMPVYWVFPVLEATAGMVVQVVEPVN
jgi:hypothetical protein